MPSPKNQTDSDPELKLPQALVNDLRAALAGKVHIPQQVDAQVWSAARQCWLRQRRRTAVRWFQAGAASAAAIALAVWLSWPTSRSAAPTPSAPPARLAAATCPSFDRSRKASILDAFTLAKSLERHAALDASWDLNQDGVVDRQDVDVIAARAVSLNERAIQ